MTGIILAAGRSKRMGAPIPKVLLPLKGRPVLEYVVNTCQAAGIKRIIAIIGHQRELVQRLFAGQALEFVVQPEQSGTAHAVLCCAGVVREDEDVVVLSGDVPLLTPITLRKLIRTLRRERADLVLLTAVVDNPRGYGRIVRDRTGGIRDIVEEKDANARQRAIREMNVGLYAFHWTRLLPILRRIRPSPITGEYYLTRAIPMLARRKGRIVSVTTRDGAEFMGINTPEELRQVERQLEQRRCG